MSRVTRGTPSGDAYLDLQNEARRTGRPTQELLQLYVLEGFLARLAVSDLRDSFVLKGGVLLAAFDSRRATKDVDLAGLDVANDTKAVLDLVRRSGSCRGAARQCEVAVPRRRQRGRPHLAVSHDRGVASAAGW